VTNSTGLLTISCLVIMGGLGYPVLNNLIAWAKSRGKPVKVRINIHTRLVLWGTVTLLVVGTSFLLVSEGGGVFAGFTPGQKIVQAFFQSVMPRTAGFNSVTLANCTTPGLVCIIALMFIGAAPASTAGGIKVTTAAVVLAFLRSLVTSSPKVNMLRREISQDLILRAVGITLCALIFLITCSIALTAVEHVTFLDAVFETVSALSTVGLTVGITAKATVSGKLILMLCMIVGRLGVLTVAWAFFLREREIPFEYPRERVMLM
jgi:trk system potassium uptake protein TrkH